MPDTWGMLPKSQIDPEIIEAAINRIVKAHNEDETAHLGLGQSLQSHKASEIIDHIAKSIITHKLAEVSRFFYAIVAPTGEDFTDIQAAIDMTKAYGRGVVMIRKGIYTLTKNLVLKSNVSLEGEGEKLSQINCNGFRVITSSILPETHPEWEDGTFNVKISGIRIYNGADKMVQYNGEIEFERCHFFGGAGSLVWGYGGASTFFHCFFGNTAAWWSTNYNQEFYAFCGEDSTGDYFLDCIFYHYPIGVWIAEGGRVVNCRFNSLRIGIHESG